MFSTFEVIEENLERAISPDGASADYALDVISQDFDLLRNETRFWDANEVVASLCIMLLNKYKFP